MIDVLAGQRALVTGAAQGNGRAIAVGLAKAGAEVVLADINEVELAVAKAEIQSFGGSARTVVWDVADPARGSEVADEVAQVAGDVSVLVNNAGILLRAPLESPDCLNSWKKTFGVNVDGQFHAARAFLDQLKRRKGCIINIASVQSYVASLKNAVPYIASKGAIVQLTKALAFELAPFGVRVNAIAPGFIETAMNEGLVGDPERMAHVLAHIPMGRSGLPQDLAGPAVFLASGLAAYVTGAVLPVDGGFLIV